MKKLTLILAIGLLIVGLVGGLSASGAQERPLVVGVAAGPRTMNPQGAHSDDNYSVVNDIFDALLQRDNEGHLMPSLATSWEKIDLTTWRFHLRKGVKFHNGNDFTWEDVEFTYKRLFDPEVSEFIFMGGVTESVELVDPSDPWAIDIKTAHPVPYYIQNVPQIWIMDKESTETRDPGEVGLYPIGTGPYKFVEWVKGSHLKVTANQDYWGGPPPIKDVTLKEIKEPSTRYAALMVGEVDIIQDVPLEMYDQAAANPDLKVITVPDRRAMYIGLRNSPGFPTSDIRVRQAIEMAINIPELIEKIYDGHASPASQVADPACFGYNPDIKRLPYDPEKARELLAEAGYPDGFTIKLTAPNDRYIRGVEVCQAIAVYLAKVGIEVELDLKPKSIFFPERDKQGLDMYWLGWFDGAYSYARTFFTLFHAVDPEKGYGASNGAGMSYPFLDSLIEKSQEIADPDLYAQWIQLGNKLAMEKVIVVPLNYQEKIYAIRKGLGIEFTPRPDTWIVYKEIAWGVGK